MPPTRPARAAAGASIDEGVSLIVHGGVIVALGAAMGISLAGLRDGRAMSPDASEERDSFESSVRWSVMTILSFVPYVNFMAWAFAAVDAAFSGLTASSAQSSTDESSEDDAGQSLYWSLAVLYFVPYVVNGFHLDTFTLLTIALGVGHVQIERAAYHGERLAAAEALPGLDVLSRLRTLRLTGLGVLDARKGSQDKEGEEKSGGDEEGDELLEEILRNDLTDFDRRLQDRSERDRSERNRLRPPDIDT